MGVITIHKYGARQNILQRAPREKPLETTSATAEPRVQSLPSMPTADVSLRRPIIAALWSMVALSGVFISLKILARVRRRMRLWWDDYLMLISWLCLIIASVFFTGATTYGLGRHIQFLDSDQRSAVLRLGYIAALFTNSAAVWSKVSFALLLLRISSSGCTEWTRRGIIGIIISLNVMLAVATVMILISCRPFEKIWRPEMEGTCIDESVKVFSVMALAVYSGVADMTLAFLSWKIIWCLPVKRRDKVGLVAVMSLGVFAGVASFIRCAYVPIMVAEDFSFDGWKLVFWAVFEPTLTIVAACIPVVRTFLRDLVRSSSTRRVSHWQHVEGETQESQGTARNAWAGILESELAEMPSGPDKGGFVPGESNAGKACEEGGTEGAAKC